MKPLSDGTITATTSGDELTTPTRPSTTLACVRACNPGATACYIVEPGMASTAATGVYLAAGAQSPLLGPYEEDVLTGSGTGTVRAITSSGTTTVGYTWYILDVEDV